MLYDREKLSGAEQKLRGAVQDKQLAVTEKAALEREVKTLKGQAGKLTKVLHQSNVTTRLDPEPLLCSNALFNLAVQLLQISSGTNIIGCTWQSHVVQLRG